MLGPVAFAFGAGMVATVNPCGFAMVPAYMSLLLADSGDHRGALRDSWKAGLVLTGAFVATFGVVGFVFRRVNDAFVDAIPWAVPFIGTGLVILGIGVLAGRHFSLRLFGYGPPTARSTRVMLVFGVAYALTSVSCTLPIFLSVVTAAATAPSFTQSISVFTAYGLGMGAVLVTLAIAIATSRDALVRSMRRAAPYVERAGGWLLVASGLFVFYYWVTVLTGDVPTNSAISQPAEVAEDLSAWFTTQITDHTLQWITAFAVIVASISTYEVWRVRRR